MSEPTRRNVIAGTSALFMLPGLAQAAAKSAHEDAKTLRFDQPAARWIEALPVGNGRLGAMVFGGVREERLQLNHIEIWSGRTVEDNPVTTRDALPEVRRLLFNGDRINANKLAQARMMQPMNGDDFGSYQMLGDLHLRFEHAENVEDYRRELDMKAAQARVSYRIGKAVYKRTVLASYPDKVLLVRLETTAPEGLSVTIKLTRRQDATISAQNGQIVLTGQPKPYGTRFASVLSWETEGGKAEMTADGVRVTGAKGVLLSLTAATDLFGADPLSTAQAALAETKGKSWKRLAATQARDHAALFNAVDLSLGITDDTRLTPSQIAAAKDAAPSPALVESYFNFGRYLLISSSRPGSLPPNLQGLWADGFSPPWSADYHINININMNFWPAEVCGIGHLHHSLFDFAERLLPYGEATARIAYGCEGAVAHYTTNPWGHTALDGRIQYGLWPDGLAWLCLHYWEHYLYTLDKAFLQTRALPFFTACARFTLSYLVEDPRTGKLVSGPASSPENSYVQSDGTPGYVDMGCAMAQSLARTVLFCTSQAAHLCGVDPELAQSCETALERLAPLRIGADGRVMEWSEPLIEHEPGHRHISQLFGLYPGLEMDVRRTPDLAEAARKTIAERLKHGGGHTGWSSAWLAMFYARLAQGDDAFGMLHKLLAHSTSESLLDLYSPSDNPIFQIDGNLGATAAIAEMLLQSHDGELRLLPALPTNWKDGHIKGIRARGGLTVDMAWRNHKVTGLSLKSKNTVTLRIVPPKDQPLSEFYNLSKAIDSSGQITLTAGKVFSFTSYALLIS
ncbi:glycoside hydrolase family 95 protein [Asticcacaulis sp. SL142]|uniref:glycoside hydrolase family 95 protein n=1 Tax=Asticcacaulis sp. SL142 TaxID=2995155 RepID=UPI00226C6B63|nr:glycoside hydrolase family 95 protein [Asticcacaulis sp. SL142]WAC48848.1 glycoside hydrolase family 95 protein [Asticcacaulis sp. SL142]